jgi:hypothetical protein
MKKIFIFSILFILNCIGICQEPQSKSFKNYTVKYGVNSRGSFIQVIEQGKVLFEEKGSEGSFDQIDTIDFNKHKKQDFIFSETFEDNFNIGIILSFNNTSYKYKSFGEFMSPALYCENFQISDTLYLKNYVVKKNRIFINCLVKNGKIIPTCMADTIKF